jgi:hypothetical protein
VLLEVGVKAQDLAVVFEPGRLDARDVVVLGCLPGLLEAEVVEGLSHLVDKVFVDFLFEELALFLLRAVKEVELLGFMVVLLVRVVEDVAREEGHLLGDVDLHSA